jgi:recombination protein RecT
MTAKSDKIAKDPMQSLEFQLVARSHEFKSALPDHIPADRFIRAVKTAVLLNTELLAADRQSLGVACMKCAADGLLPDNRDAAFVVMGGKVVYLPMIGGLLKRFRNSGQFKAITAGIVRDGEEFNYWIDEHGEHMKHVPGDGTGKAIKAYAMAETKDGGVMIKVMSESEINKRRSASRAKNSPLWTEWTDEAWQKTVLRNLAKRLPTSSDLDDLIRRDDDLEADKKDNPHPNVKPLTAIADRLDAFGGEQAQPGAEMSDELELKTGAE